jgi:hypothetical protein
MMLFKGSGPNENLFYIDNVRSQFLVIFHSGALLEVRSNINVDFGTIVDFISDLFPPTKGML